MSSKRGMPGADWPELSAPLDTLASEAELAAGQAWSSWRTHLEAQLFGPIRELAADAGARHKHLLEKCTRDGKSPTQASIAAYRIGVTGEVLGKVADGLGTLRLHEGLGQISVLLTALDGQISDAVKICELPLSFYASEPGQKRWLTRRLIWCRIQIVQRLSAMVKKPAKDIVRKVPVGALLQYHAQVRLAKTAADLQAIFERQLAGLVAGITAGFTAWTQAMIDLERSVESVCEMQSPSSILPDGTPSPESDFPDPERALQRIADDLQEMLDSTVLQAKLHDADAADALAADACSLRMDLRCAGTFLLKNRQRNVVARRPARHLSANRLKWVEWHRQERNRLDLNIIMLRMQDALHRSRRDILSHVHSVAMAPVRDTFQSLNVELNDAVGRCGESETGDLANRLQHLVDGTLNMVRTSLGNLPGLLAAEETLARPGKKQWGMLDEAVNALPEELALHAVPKPGAIIEPAVKPELRQLRHEIRLAMASVPEQLADCARPLRRELVEVWTASEAAIEIVDFGLKGALDELAAGKAADNARELAQGGLQRAAALLQDLAESLNPPWQEFVRSVSRLFEQEFFSSIHHCLRAETNIEERMLGLKVRLRQAFELIRRYARHSGLVLRHAATKVLTLGRRRAGSIIDRGRSAMGVAAEIERDRLQTVESIDPDSVHALQDRLPLVYRRLFSRHPVSLPWQLEGRSADLAYVKEYVNRWQRRRKSRPLVLPMLPGSGRTSLMQVIASDHGSTIDVDILTLNHRLTGYKEFVQAAARVMGSGEASSWDELHKHLLQSKPRICLVDNLEHLFLRTYGGTNLIEDVLFLMSNTASRVCWISNVSQFAWEYLEKALSNVSALADVFSASTLNKTTVENIMLNRHRRSGLSLHFHRPATVPQVLSRRLKYARSDQVQQTLLRDYFFERLFDSCGSNLKLALIYWLRAAEFDGGTVAVQPHNPLSFRFLESISLEHAFTLKAFLIHSTLSLKEHAEVFRMTNSESSVVLGSLLSQALILPCRSGSPGRDSNRTKADRRFRLHPLVQFPVQQRLRKMNIIH